MRFDFTFVCTGGQCIERKFLDEQSAPKVGEITEIEVEGEQQQILITKLWGPFRDVPGT